MMLFGLDVIGFIATAAILSAVSRIDPPKTVLGWIIIAICLWVRCLFHDLAGAS